MKNKHVLACVLDMCKKNENYDNKTLVTEACHEYMERIKACNILKYGNNKLHKNIARFTLPEVVTCSASCKGCYAKKRTFHVIKKSRLKNLFIIEHAMHDNYFYNLLNITLDYELNKHALNCKENLKLQPIMRWHDSGDIYNLRYLYFIIDVAKRHSDILFYTYTKNFEVWKEYKKLKDMGFIPDNFNIVSSYIYNHVNYFDFTKNFDNEIQALENILIKASSDNIKIYMCNYFFDKLPSEKQATILDLIEKYNNTIGFNPITSHCGLNCHACCKYEFVIFIKH